MHTVDWIIFGLVWALIPSMFLLKGFFDRRWNKVYHETQPEIDKGIKDLIKLM